MVETTERSELLASDEVGSKPEYPCHICGGCSYTWGMLSAQGIHFTPDDASILARTLGFGTRLPTRRCDGCGNLQVFDKLPRGQR